MLPAVVNHTLDFARSTICLRAYARCLNRCGQPTTYACNAMRHDQGSLSAFVLHHVEGVHNHGGEIGSLALACDDLGNVVELLRVGYRQDAALAGLHPDGLVVMAPVKQVAIAGLLQKIRGERRLRNPGAQPTLRTLAGVLFDCRCRFAQ